MSADSQGKDKRDVSRTRPFAPALDRPSDATVWARLALFGPRAHHGLAALLIELYGLWLALQKR